MMGIKPDVKFRQCASGTIAPEKLVCDPKGANGAAGAGFMGGGGG